jgi:type IV secretory pathway TrbL component
MNLLRWIGVVVLALVALVSLVNLVPLVAASFLAATPHVSAQAIGAATFNALLVAGCTWGAVKLARWRRGGGATTPSALGT